MIFVIVFCVGVRCCVVGVGLFVLVVFAMVCVVALCVVVFVHVDRDCVSCDSMC